MTTVYGWDLGGANIKRARVEGGVLADVVQIPCPILADRRKFDQAVAAAFSNVEAPALHGVTMTGELSDVFTDREDGVAYLIALMQRLVGGERLQIYAGRAGFLPPEEARRRAGDVASANWHATAAYVASRMQDALIADIGTTTTDLVPVKDGGVAAHGFTDGERLVNGELVYTGVVRTPVMAIAQTAPFAGHVQRIAAERFATMADVYRLTGDLAEDADPYPAADSRGKREGESAARLARMLGRDLGDAPLSDWAALAKYFAACQLALIERAAREVSDRVALPRAAPVVGAGCGRFLAESLAARLRRPYLDFAAMIGAADDIREMASRCAPAAAVALLAGP